MTSLAITIDPFIQPIVTAVVTIAGMWILNKFKSIELKMQLDAQTAQLKFKTEETGKKLAAKTNQIASELGTKVEEVGHLVNADLEQWKAELVAQFEARMAKQVELADMRMAKQEELTAAAIKATHVESFAAGQEDMRQKLAVPSPPAAEASIPARLGIPTEGKP